MSQLNYYGRFDTMRKVLAITTIRSDYDLLSSVYKLLHKSEYFDLKLLVGGTHLSPAFGSTVNEIKADGFSILGEIESLHESDSLKARLKSASNLLQGAIDMVSDWQPDLILFAGDREDVLIGGMLGAFLNIPTIHFFGGDHETDGHTDTVIRHATSKLSTFHIVTIEEHKQRLLRMGEPAHRIFVSGNPALDKFAERKRKPSDSVPPSPWLSKDLSSYALLIYHPLDKQSESPGETFDNILQALQSRGIAAAVSFPNSDPGHLEIIRIIERYSNHSKFWFYKNLPRDEFMRLYYGAQFLIGNSSSGILEAASIPLAAINVGLRQRDRYCGANVIFCSTNVVDITNAIDAVQSTPFRDNVAKITNPYGDGASALKIFEFIRNHDFRALIKKIEDPLKTVFQ